MTASFLEYVFRRQFGRGPWRCPYCDAGHFSVQPPKDGHRIKFHCFTCQRFGDEFDIFKDIRGVRNYQDRIELRAAWHADYVRDEQPTAEPHTHTSPRGVRVKGASMITDEDAKEAVKAIDRLLEPLPRPTSAEAMAATIEALRPMLQPLSVCAEFDLHPAALAERVSFEIWFRSGQAEHMAICKDPDCEDWCCRAARGWTDEQIREAVQKAQREHAEMRRQKQERVEAMRKHINKRSA